MPAFTQLGASGPTEGHGVGLYGAEPGDRQAERDTRSVTGRRAPIEARRRAGIRAHGTRRRGS